MATKKTAAEEQLDASPFMTTRDVAVILKICHKSVCNRLEDGTLPGFKVGRLWRCRRDQIMLLGLRSREDHE